MPEDQKPEVAAEGVCSDEKSWPLDARTAVYSLEVTGKEDIWKSRRHLPRHMCRVEGTVVSGNDPASLADAIVYLRDVNERFVGFISTAPLRKGEIYWLHCDRIGVVIHAQIRIIRCNNFMDDWFDCAAAFVDDQTQFGPRAA